MNFLAIPVQWVALALLLSNLATGAFGYFKGGAHASNAIAKQDARDMRLLELAQSAVAQELSKLRVEHNTIRQKTEVITREVPVYRDCQHDDAALGMLNDALTPPELRDRDTQLPGADAGR